MNRNQIIFIAAWGAVIIITAFAVSIWMLTRPKDVPVVLPADTPSVPRITPQPVIIRPPNIAACIDVSLQRNTRIENDSYKDAVFGGSDGVLMWLSTLDHSPDSTILYTEVWRTPGIPSEVAQTILVLDENVYSISRHTVAPISATCVAVVAYANGRDGYVWIHDTLTADRDQKLFQPGHSPVVLGYDADHLHVVWHSAGHNFLTQYAYDSSTSTFVPTRHILNLNNQLDYDHVCLHAVGESVVIGFSVSNTVLYHIWNANGSHQELTGSGQFGYSVALNRQRTMLAVGNPASNGEVSLFTKAGRMFSKVPTHTWVAQPPFFTPENQDQMGFTVAWMDSRIYAGKMGLPVICDTVTATQEDWVVAGNGNYLRLGSTFQDHNTGLLGVQRLHLSTFQCHGGALVSDVILSADGRYLYTSSADMTVKQWNTTDQYLVRTFTGHTTPATKIALHGNRLCAAGEDFSILVWDITDGSLLKTLTGHTQLVHALAIHNALMYSASGDQTIKRWDLNGPDGAITTLNVLFTEHVYALAVSADGTTLFSSYGYSMFAESYDSVIRQWRTSDMSAIRTFEGHVEQISSLALSADSKTLYSCAEYVIKQWDVDSGVCTRTMTHATDHTQVTKIVLSADGTILFASTFGSGIMQWDPTTGVNTRTLTGQADIVWVMALSLDGSTLYTIAEFSNTMKRWRSPFTEITHHAAVFCD